MTALDQQQPPVAVPDDRAHRGDDRAAGPSGIGVGHGSVSTALAASASVVTSGPTSTESDKSCHRGATGPRRSRPAVGRKRFHLPVRTMPDLPKTLQEHEVHIAIWSRREFLSAGV